MKPSFRLIREPGVVWVHIDRFGKSNNKVWAVQYVTRSGRSVWLCVRDVVCKAPWRTRTHPTGVKQPRGYLVVRNATVRVRGGGH